MTNLRSILRSLALVSTLALAACGAPATTAGAGGGAAEPKAAPSGPKAPDFTLPALDGSTGRLSDHLGKGVILIDFWSTTCDPCLAEMPHLVELYKKYKDQGFTVLAISLDGPESRSLVSSVVHDKGMIFPVLLDEETSVVARYNPKRELPFSVLIGKDGSILEKHSGYQHGEEEKLRGSIEKALAP